MEGPSLEVLRGQRRDLSAALVETRLALRQARQQERDRAKRLGRAWALTDPLVRVVLIIYNLSEYDHDPAIEFLRDTAHKRRWPQKPEAELRRLVEDRFLEADPDELAAWVDKSAPADPGALDSAIKYVEQWQLVKWTMRLNEQAGVAPSSDAALQCLEEGKAKLPEAHRPKPAGTSAEAKGRMWARRWRLKWGGRIGKVRVQDDVTVQEMQDKAPPEGSICCQILGSRLGPFSGRKIGPTMRITLRILVLGPDFGLDFGAGFWA